MFSHRYSRLLVLEHLHVTTNASFPVFNASRGQEKLFSQEHTLYFLMNESTSYSKRVMDGVGTLNGKRRTSRTREKGEGRWKMEEGKKVQSDAGM